MSYTRFASRSAGFWGVVSLAFWLAGCDAPERSGPSAAPDQPWTPDGTPSDSFAVRGEIPLPDGSAPVAPEGALGLAELIDLGQRNNPVTRKAWLEARQAAAGVGLVEASFLPLITANVVGGVQEIVTPIRRPLSGEIDDVTTTSRAVVPNVTLAWLLFDFGERQAFRQAAEQIANAANVTFNATHQALIFNITRSYYLYGTAREHVTIARQTRRNSLALLEAAEERLERGLGTSIETAQARQIAAQSEFRLVTAEDRLSDAYQDLLAAVGVSPRSQIEVRAATGRRLPRARAVPTDELIREALSRRPDVLASYAALQASAANERAAQAAFSPKVFLAAIAEMNSGRIQTGALPPLGVSGQGAGVFLGVTMPIYDGQLRENRLQQAQDATRVAEASYEQMVNLASREIIMASNALDSALAAHDAATALVEAAQTSYDATFEAYRSGLGTITAVSVAESGLLDAREAQADAHAAALVAASTLAFALGEMTSRDAPARALR